VCVNACSHTFFTHHPLHSTGNDENVFFASSILESIQQQQQHEQQDKKKKNFKRGTNENTHKQHQPRMGDQKDRDHRGWATMTADAKNKKQTKKSNFHRLF
jgi:hypothetical protein